ncbi:MAG: lipoyl synthase [Bdellovibrionaceae bacterium]|nr:lipoyl synthase [Pseudobdellovibrionaceae bacterium]
MIKKTLKKPNWLKVPIPSGERFSNIKKLAGSLSLATVCQEARCPNIGECWQEGTATFMVMGDTCTRGCRFCSVKTGNPKGVLDQQEPQKLAYAIQSMGLNYVVVTSVDRDDLNDGGAQHFANCITETKALNPKTLVEVLTSDFAGFENSLKTVLQARPDVYAHNVETVERLQSAVRDPRANYKQSLQALKFAAKFNKGQFTKSSIMLGLGETDEEVLQTLKDLKAVGCQFVTLGQYLQPAKHKLSVQEYVSVEKFNHWKSVAEDMGFLYAASGPLVRSSYRAGEFFMKSLLKKQKKDLNCLV